MTDGQKLWGWKSAVDLQALPKPAGDLPGAAEWEAGRAGGPKLRALRRLPVLPELYDPKYRPFRSDPDINPYEAARDFSYHAEWTGSLFQTFAFIVRVMCIDTHDELCAAWKALLEARAHRADGQFPPQALAAFQDVEAIAYQHAKERIAPVLRSSDKIAAVQLAKELAGKFRENYEKAAELAREGK
jgi:iron(III) transport system substrate-binding protein